LPGSGLVVIVVIIVIVIVIVIVVIIVIVIVVIIVIVIVVHVTCVAGSRCGSASSCAGTIRLRRASTRGWARNIAGIDWS
jgi:uncharacterized membrane protein